MGRPSSSLRCLFDSPTLPARARITPRVFIVLPPCPERTPRSGRSRRIWPQTLVNRWKFDCALTPMPLTTARAQWLHRPFGSFVTRPHRRETALPDFLDRRFADDSHRLFTEHVLLA